MYEPLNIPEPTGLNLKTRADGMATNTNDGTIFFVLVNSDNDTLAWFPMPFGQALDFAKRIIELCGTTDAKPN